MQLSIIDSLINVEANAWNALIGNDNPFARHEFLYAMEKHDAVGETFGWYPQYIVGYDNEKLVAAVPMYLKTNSYGEFVFDWSWADAYERAGGHYYPKLVISIPYTPATGNRLFMADHLDLQTTAMQLIDFAIEHANKLNVSSLHCLFTNDRDTTLFRHHPGIMMRLGCQFHWQNNHYSSFDNYLETFSANKRKKIKRERRRVKEQGIKLEVFHGNEASEEQWDTYHQFYQSTFDRKSGMATFSNGFFKEIAQTMPENIVLVMASYNNRYVASAFNVRGQQSLFGRHWGCLADFHSLHFEACYYQGLEYAINHKLSRFEPGAQGEHKISRGFLPTATWSAHWIADPVFRDAIDNFLVRETQGMHHYIEELTEHTPFKKS